MSRIHFPPATSTLSGYLIIIICGWFGLYASATFAGQNHHTMPLEFYQDSIRTTIDSTNRIADAITPIPLLEPLYEKYDTLQYDNEVGMTLSGNSGPLFQYRRVIGGPVSIALRAMYKYNVQESVTSHRLLFLPLLQIDLTPSVMRKVGAYGLLGIRYRRYVSTTQGLQNTNINSTVFFTTGIGARYSISKNIIVSGETLLYSYPGSFDDDYILYNTVRGSSFDPRTLPILVGGFSVSFGIIF